MFQRQITYFFVYRKKEIRVNDKNKHLNIIYVLILF